MNLTIPFNDIRRHTSLYREEIDAAIRRVLNSGQLLLGEETASLEKALCDLLGVSHCIGVGNGTDAIEIALRSLKIANGDIVVTVGNAGGYSTTAILQVGAIPLYCEISRETLQMDPRHLLDLLESHGDRIAAVIVTHLYGQMAEIEVISELVSKFDVPLLEDCAQAIGAKVGGRSAGSFGIVSTTSFYPTKNLGGIGDGGAIMTDSPQIAARARKLRQYGWSRKYAQELPMGRNSRIDEINAAVLTAKVAHFDSMIARRNAIHSHYQETLPDGLLVHRVSSQFVPHLSVLLVRNRQSLRQELLKKGVSTEIHYPIPDYLQLPNRAGGTTLGVTENTSDQVLSIPNFPELSDSEVEWVASQAKRHALGIQ